jgi:predicted RNA-binding Zn-ribbon protein involved in translation (DUF1610 family)
MIKPRFYQAVLHPLNEKEVKRITKGQSIADRMGSENAECPECGKNEWWLLPTMSSAVREGGKPYCECLNCGYVTHL